MYNRAVVKVRNGKKSLRKGKKTEIMIPSEIKEEILNDILESRTFAKSTTSKMLLKVLVEASIKESEISGTSLAMEFYGSRYVPEKSEAAIRVNIYHLREKLSKYYSNEGGDEVYRIHIDKGQYQIDFIKKSALVSKVSGKRYAFNPKGLLLVAAIVIIAIVGINAFDYQKTSIVWEPFVNNGKTTSLYLGDIYGFAGPSAFGNHGWQRDYKINSDEDLDKAVQEHPEITGNYYPSKNMFIPFSNTRSAVTLATFLSEKNLTVTINRTSNATFQDLNNNNSIYVGKIKQKNVFNRYFNVMSENVKLRVSENSPEGLIVFKNYKNGQDTIVEPAVDGARHFEHALVTRFVDPYGNVKLFFFSNHGYGTRSAVKLFTTPEFLERFERDYLQESEEFTALFLVKGRDNMDVNIELVMFVSIDGQSKKEVSIGNF
ncbi:MAG: hypothetical protein JXR10_00190 [Cyclobacteriaceae bacterium]